MWSFNNQTQSLFEQICSLFTPPCLLCNGFSANLDNYCPGCYADLPHNHYCCAICALPFDTNLGASILCGDCLRQPPHLAHGFDQALVALHYLPPISSLVHALKDHDNQAAGRLLAACLYQYIHLNNPDLPQLILPMPLHKKRLQQRGFNQAKVIGKLLSKRFGISLNDRIIKREKDTASQQGLNKQQRRSNLRQAFTISPSASVRKILAEVQHIAIVDDVMTTGASANAVAKALRKAAGHELHIDVWCVARTLPPNSKLHLY
ncbi:MAG TPA: hypothetical protein DE179_01540 [Oceanospirillaceae bacterium]|nr:hypothetical protein [Oceanospirillaceae bacterium]